MLRHQSGNGLNHGDDARERLIPELQGWRDASDYFQPNGDHKELQDHANHCCRHEVANLTRDCFRRADSETMGDVRSHHTSVGGQAHWEVGTSLKCSQAN